jgi:flagellar biosynthesis protein FlhA
MRAASVTRPLDFSVFPSLLLVVTFARLSLNIATTRLILGNAAEGPLAAGKVVQTFGSFVGGDNLVVGFVIFTVIVLVQFVVITRGATRVSEVAARFQLDAMPGKQMSIDGDLAAGLIDQESASERRQEVGREADFYGSMDGASKFVRGDAVAGIVIMMVNIIGGLGIGMIYHGMSAAGALEVFGRLTIGDGLVSQVPALMVSIAAALLVTRSASSEQLSTDLGRQVFSSDWILFTAAVFLWLLLPSGLPVPMLLMTSAACGCCGFILRRERIEKEARERTVLQSEELDQARVPVVDVKTLMKVETLELLIGFHLVSLQDRDRGGDLLEHLASMRQKLALELGLHVPSVKVSDSKEIGSREYCFRLRGTRLGTWRIIPGGSLALQKDDERPAVSGELPFDFESSIDLADGSGFWIPDSMEEQAHEAGCQLVSPSTAIALHLEDCITAHAAELLTYERVSQILADLKEKSPSLVDEFVPQTVKIGQLQKVLQDASRPNTLTQNLRETRQVLEEEQPQLVVLDPLSEGGQVEVEQQRQVVQHPDGGVVEEIAVTDGQSVAAGDLLIRLDGSLVKTELTIVEGQYFEILARRGRLEAERAAAGIPETEEPAAGTRKSRSRYAGSARCSIPPPLQSSSQLGGGACCSYVQGLHLRSWI